MENQVETIKYTPEKAKQNALATLVKPGEKLDKYNLPIFIQYKDLSLPLMEITFKKIYEEFFSSNEIAEIPKLMADSQKKYSTDEILTILKTIHLYAYFVINTQIKREFFDKDLLNEDSYNKIFKEIPSWKGFKSILKLLNQNSNKQEVATQIYNLSLQQQTYQIHLKKVYKDKDTYNIDILSFEFPELYINQIKKLMYGNFCVACFSGTYKKEPMWSHYANCENWEYEQEYRVFKMDMVHPTYEDKNNRLAKYNFEDLDAIIFGSKVSFDDKKGYKNYSNTLQK